MEEINIVMVGYFAGKTVFLNRFIDNYYYENIMATSCIDFRLKNIKLKNGKEIKIKLWDTAGNEGYRSLSGIFLRMADGGILMYKIIDRSSFETVSYWINEIKEINIPGIIIGNLCDLSEEREVSKEEGEELSKINGFHFYESSNKLGINIEEPIYDLVEQILKIREEKELNKININSIKLNNKKNEKIKNEDKKRKNTENNDLEKKNKKNLKDDKKRKSIVINNSEKEINIKKNIFKMGNNKLNIYFKYINY